MSIKEWPPHKFLDKVFIVKANLAVIGSSSHQLKNPGKRHGRPQVSLLEVASRLLKTIVAS